jgi:hypothetical protein
VFINRRTTAVELFWIDRDGKPISYGGIPAGESKRQKTRPGAVWQIGVPDSGIALGYFEGGDRKSKAVIPKK